MFLNIVIKLLCKLLECLNELYTAKTHNNSILNKFNLEFINILCVVVIPSLTQFHSVLLGIKICIYFNVMYGTEIIIKDYLCKSVLLLRSLHTSF